MRVWYFVSLKHINNKGLKLFQKFFIIEIMMKNLFKNKKRMKLWL